MGGKCINNPVRFMKINYNWNFKVISSMQKSPIIFSVIHKTHGPYN
jgi:hypothetical protein